MRINGGEVGEAEDIDERVVIHLVSAFGNADFS
jgi:hypothetical protein